MNLARRIGFFGGLGVFGIILLYPAFFPLPQGLSIEGLRVMAVVALMATWWVTEAIPIPATSLLPIALFPVLGVMKSAEVTKPYANHLIYLFIGGFFLAKGIERWDLHKRIALHIIRIVGVSPRRVILGFMVATAFLSMWVSNTATTMMMLPVGLAVISQIVDSIKRETGEDINPEKFNFGIALMLGIAYAASIGGVGTIIGTPPNTVMAGIVEQRFGQQISFASWMAFGVPLSITFLILAWFVLVKIIYPPEIDTIPGGRELVEEEIKALGPISKEEKLVALVFSCVATAWIIRGFLTTTMVADATIAMIGAVSLFLIPTDFKKGEFLMDWQTAVTIPWGVVVLFGGGLALTAAVSKVGLAHWVAGYLSVLHGLTMVFLIIIVVLITIFLTELTSNTATATLLVPIMGGTAVAMGIHPYGIIVATCVATSYAFMLPVATPPNAVVFGSGYVTIFQMSKAGLWMNLIGSLLILLFTLGLLPLVWGIDLSVLPQWAMP